MGKCGQSLLSVRVRACKYAPAPRPADACPRERLGVCVYAHAPGGAFACVHKVVAAGVAATCVCVRPRVCLLARE